VWSHPAVGARRPTGLTRAAHAVPGISATGASPVTRGPAASPSATVADGAAAVRAAGAAGAVGEATTVARAGGSASVGGATASSAASARGPSA